MPLPWEDIELDAAAFAKRWKNARSEKSDAQGFVRDFLAVFGVEDAAAVGNFENPALREEGHGFMDYFWPGKIAVEMKSRGKDLKVAYAQLKEHVLKLPSGEMPELLLVSDFEKMIIYRRTANKKAEFLTKNLHKHVRRFGELAGYGTVRVLENQYEVDVMAAEKMARLHAAFDKSGYEGHELEIYLVRLLFCMFAEDTGIFEQYSFLSYVENSKEDGSDLSQRLATLFEILDTPSDKRSKRTHLADELKQFRYINGSLFSDTLRQPDFDAKMRKVLIHCCEFDWSKISPAIFGSIFQGIMDKNRRRKVGAHYTSIENIEKLLKPLFLDGLWAEFEQKQGDKQALDAFHQKLAGLKFFDPACGCGNFLMIAYQRLRELEFELLKILHGAVLPGKGRQKMLDLSMYVRVSVEQFYGIEIEDFPCEIAKVGLWLIDHLMNREASLFFAVPFNRLPLTQNPTIVHGNAMRIDWESVVPKEECSYILSNPPYVGKQYQSKEQKDDVALTLRDIPGYGVLDYVACWYFTAAQYVQGTEIRVGFVSTNSVTQGEQVAVLWRELFAKNVKINFGYTMFKWWNEGKYKAAVHCVIIGFSLKESDPKHIFEEQDGKIKARRVKNINPYLIDGPSVLITSRSKPLCDVPEIVFGSMPNDGGHLLFSNEEKREFLKLEPEAKRWIQPFVGAIEFINGISRWCLWLVDISPGELRNLTEVRKRLQAVKRHRLASRRETTRELAKMPYLFGEIRQPKGKYILIPRVSSERRTYIPIGFVSPKTIAGDATLIIPNAKPYHFGILTSIVHMAWMRRVCGRLEIDYRYSARTVYNNFPWPEVMEKRKAKIEALAQNILDVRAEYPESSLAELYDPLTMPPELLNAHQTLDRAVLKLYGFSPEAPESKIVAGLMELYGKLTQRVFQTPG